MRTLVLMLVVACMVTSDATAKVERRVELFPDVSRYVDSRIGEFDRIPAERRKVLEGLTAYIQDCRKGQKPVRLTFICTHNSRRSHMSQLWASVAASRYSVQGVETFSGGTEGTAFNPRAVAAMQRAGLRVKKPGDDRNPRYEVTFAAGIKPQVCFSKVFDEKPNPKKDYCAVMTCTDADKACPSVPGAAVRIAIPFDDPKVADGTPMEASKYDERCAQIAREMLYVFSKAR